MLLELFAALAATLQLLETGTQKFKTNRGAVGIFVVALIWFLLSLRATLLSFDYSSSWPALAKSGAFLLLFFTTTATVTKPVFTQQLFSAAVWTGIIHSLIAIQEYIEAPPIPATWIDPALKEFVRTRCAGIFTDPNIFGAFLAVLFIFILTALLQAEKPKNLAITGTALLLTGFAELTTLSRGSWIALAAGLICLAFILWRGRDEKIKFVLPTLILVILAAIALLGPFRYRIFSIVKTQDMTIAQRSLILKGFRDNFASLPLIGHGPHSFNQVYPKFRAVGGDYPMNAHNELLHSLVETGHLSALCLLLLFMQIFLPSLRRGQSLTGAASASVLLCLFIHNMGGFSSRILPTTLMIVLAAAVTRVASRNKFIILNRRLKTVFALLILLTIFLTLVWGLQSYSINVKMRQAYQAMSEGQASQALELFSQVEKSDPTNAVASSRKAEIYLALNDKTAAKNALIRAVSANPGEALYWLQLARLSPENQAEEYYQKAVELDPASELFRLEFARFLAKIGEKQRAVAQLDAALTTSPGFHQVYRHYLEIEAFKAKLTSP